MGKFSGILLCTDIDGTLLNDEHKVSQRNTEAIEYFKREGGIFTLATGRVPHGMNIFLDKAAPNAPVISHNGSSIYDFEKQRFLWTLELDDKVCEVIDLVLEHMPFAGVEIVKGGDVYFCRMNDTVEEHRMLENFPLIRADYKSLNMPWTKILFIQMPEELPVLKEFLMQSQFTKRYKFVQSSPKYFEVINKNSSKGNALKELAKILNIPMSMTIAIGDNENDLEMVQYAGIGIAVENAIHTVKKVASHITVDNNSDAVAKVIEGLDSGELNVK